MKKRIWIVPANDLEAVEIKNLLLQQEELVFVSQQTWGASWEKLESSIVESINDLSKLQKIEVIGIELAGKPAWKYARTLDHHRWADHDGSHEMSSIEQVAQLLNIPLNPYQQLVAANDKGWIPALIAAGAPQGVIDAIRMSDRCAQGVSPDDEAQAVRDVENAETKGRKIRITTKKVTSAIGDRLYGRFDEVLNCGPDKWIYTGPKHREIFEAVQSSKMGTKNDWMGGSPTSGYCGFISPTESVQEIILSIFWGEQ